MKDKWSSRQLRAYSPHDGDAPVFLALGNVVDLFEYDQCEADSPERWELLETIDFNDREQVEKVVREILVEALPNILGKSRDESSFMRNLFRDFDVFINNSDISIWDSSIAGHMVLPFSARTGEDRAESERLGREFINSLYRVVFGD